MRRLIEGLMGGVCGAGIGGFFGVMLAIGAVYWSVAAHPDDASAGAGIAFIAFRGGLLGALLGLVTGFVAGISRKTGSSRLRQVGQDGFESKEAFDSWLTAQDR